LKFLIIGHLCVDVAHPLEGPESEAWGGIAHAIATLGVLAGEGENDTVVPVCGVGEAEQPAFLAWLGRFPAVELSGVYVSKEPTNKIHLYEQEGGVRVACARDIAPPVAFDRLKRFLNADGIMINMSSGFDITLESLDQIRMEVRAKGTPVHFDYHNLTMGVNRHGVRFRRPIPDWRRWAFMIPTVQLNEAELAGLAMEPLTEQQTVGHLLTLGPKGVIVTRGERGATLFTNEHKKVARHDIAGIPAAETPDSTGLGDVFGAAFLYHYAGSSDLPAAAELANRAAALAAGRTRTERWTAPRPAESGPPGDSVSPTGEPIRSRRPS
jgi:sugar/nucleoside kinase (ribokinase family)